MIPISLGLVLRAREGQTWLRCLLVPGRAGMEAPAPCLYVQMLLPSFAASADASFLLLLSVLSVCQSLL